MVRGLERGRDHRAVGHERDVVSLASRRRDADRHDLVAFRHWTPGASVQVLVLEVHDRIVIADGGFQQSFRVVGGRRRHDLQPRTMDEPRFGVLRVIQAPADITATRRAHDNGHRCPAAVTVPERRRLVDDLIEPARDEIGELHLGDRPVATQRGADADADDG